LGGDDFQVWGKSPGGELGIDGCNSQVDFE
jgi:hypothetical protein